jgi:prevent-host-death family protein
MAREMGIRQLRDELSAVIEAVEAGETVVVTRHGRAVARVVPAGASPGLAELVAAGRATWSGGPLPELPEPVALRGDGPSMADLVIEGRR